MKKVLPLIVYLIITLTHITAQAQVTGSLIDKDSREPLIQAAVQLLQPKDSAYVTGGVSNYDGQFSIGVNKTGSFIMKISNVGYKTLCRNITVGNARTLHLGEIRMEPDAIMLKEVVAQGIAAKMTVKEDTFVYNAAAYHTPEGSTIEELVRRLPGAQIDDNGKITINGKEVKKIKVDGKEFMLGDTETALKNLPTSIIDRVKSYDEKSDLAKMTGVDDGEEETVLDFNIKRGMNKGFMTNIDLAIGNKDRYAERGMGAYMKDNSRFMLFGNFNNTGDRGFTGGGRGGNRNNNGLQTRKMLGANYNYELKDKLTLDVSLRWNHNDTDNRTTSATENFISTVGAFTNSNNVKLSRSNAWNMNAKVEWKPDTLTTIMLRPQFRTSTSDSKGNSQKVSYNENPASYTNGTDPLDSEMLQVMENAGVLVNNTDNTSLSYSRTNTFNLQGTGSRRLSRNGRNITLQGRYSSGDTDSESLSHQHIIYYLTGQSDVIKNRYNLSPSDDWSYRMSFTYSEPIALATFLQLRYQYQYNNKKSERRTYDFSQFPAFGEGIVPEYRNFNAYLNPYVTPEHPLDEYIDMQQSRNSEYDNYIHEIELTLRRTTDKYNLNVGVMLQPQVSDLYYRKGDYDDVTRRTVTNFTPTLDYRYRFNKQKNIRLNYRGSTAQPSMTDMLPITDDTDPLNITVGNPGLKPSFTNNFRLNYNNYIQEHMRTVMAFVRYTNTRNSVSNSVTYDPATGGRTTRPENINGNWDISGAVMLNTSLDSIGTWNLNTFSNISYVNYASFVNLDKAAESTKTYTRSATFMERLGFGYRSTILEAELNGTLNYTNTRNKLQPNANLDTWQFTYGTDITVNAPWGMSFTTGAHMQSRRGYSDSSMNTNEFVWNAQISQGLLRGKPLTLSLQFYDLLHQMSSFSRTISATQRTDTYSNSINSYMMLHAIYRFNAFGGKNSSGNKNNNKDPFAPGGGMGSRGGNFGSGYNQGLGGGNRNRW